ncbi:unnamed protein product, partial [Prunus brigantina]
FVFVPSSSSSSSSRDLRLRRHPLIFVFIPLSKSKTETRPSSTRNREIPCFPLLQSSYTLLEDLDFVSHSLGRSCCSVFWKILVRNYSFSAIYV